MGHYEVGLGRGLLILFLTLFNKVLPSAGGSFGGQRLVLFWELEATGSIIKWRAMTWA